MYGLLFYAIQAAAYIKRNKKRVRSIADIDNVGDIVAYGKAHNFLQMVKFRPGLGVHDHGVILVYKGQLLNEDNEWEDLPHTCEHSHLGRANEVPQCLQNLQVILSESQTDRSDTALQRVTACIHECVAQAEGKAKAFILFL